MINSLKETVAADEMTKLIAQAIGRKKQDGETFNTIWKDRVFSGFGLLSTKILTLRFLFYQNHLG